MKNKTNKKVLIIIIVIVVLILSYIVLSLSTNEKEYTSEEIIEQQKETAKTTLSNLTEEERIEHYVTNFLRNIEYKKYSENYDILYKDFKELYFPVVDSFERYLKTYFPSEFACEYTNIERINNIYVLWVNIKDIEKEKNDFSMNIVIRENDYDDYEISFSVNSAKEANSIKEENI